MITVIDYGVFNAEPRYDVIAYLRRTDRRFCRIGSRAGLPYSTKLVILSGGPFFVSECHLHDLKAIGVPVLGICLGALMTVKQLGGKLAINQRRTREECDASHNGDEMFDGVDPEFRISVAHREEIVDLPGELRATAHCGNEIVGFRHRSLPIFGVVFHPEEEAESRVIDNFLRS